MNTKIIKENALEEKTFERLYKLFSGARENGFSPEDIEEDFARAYRHAREKDYGALVTDIETILQNYFPPNRLGP